MKFLRAPEVIEDGEAVQPTGAELLTAVIGDANPYVLLGCAAAFVVITGMVLMVRMLKRSNDAVGFELD